MVKNMENFYITLNKSCDKWILFLHGWGVTYQTMLPLVKSVKTEYNTISILLPFCKQFPLNRPYKIEDILSYVHNILNENKIIPDLIVAHSCGAKIACAYNLNIKNTPLVLIAPSILKPRFSLKRFWKIKKYKILKKQQKNGRNLNKCSIRYGSNDYQKCDGNLKKTFLKMVHTYFDRDINDIKDRVIILIGKDDYEIDNKKLLKLSEKHLKVKTYLMSGNHFAYKRHIDWIKEVIKENVGH